MKRLLSFVLTALFMFMSTAVFADDINGVGEIHASQLNVRSAPDTDAKIIGELKDGDSVDIITKTNKTWYKISFNGEAGFVHADYVEASRHAIVKTGVKEQSAEEQKKGQAVVDAAKEFLGGTSPEGFDCSGLVYYIYVKIFGVSLYRVAADQAKNGVEVNPDYLMPGDLVFFWNKERYSEINHVGIYIGDGKFIHAPATGDVVKISSLSESYFKKTFCKARRIFE